MKLRPGRLLATASAALLALGVAACGSSGDPGGTAGTPTTGATHPGHVITATIPPPAPLRAGESFETLVLPQAYTPQPPHGGTDEYRCFLVDPKLQQNEYLTGSQFLPQNQEIVHHAIVYRVDPADVAQARARDDADPGEGWTCFGGSGIRSQNDELSSSVGWVGAWAPGGKETLFDAKVGYPLAPGSLLVLQVHYNLLATDGRPGPTDQSSVRLRLTKGGPGYGPLRTTLVAAPIELPCTSSESGPLCDRAASIADLQSRFGSGARSMVSGLNYLCNAGGTPTAGTTQHCDQRITQPGLVYSVAGHMHLLGRSIKVELNPGTPKAKTLLDLPQFNFDDQAARPMATPVPIKPGDVVRVTCTHDASLRSKLPELQSLKPRYVVWGDGTSDEMCLGILAWGPAA